MVIQIIDFTLKSVILNDRLPTAPPSTPFSPPPVSVRPWGSRPRPCRRDACDRVRGVVREHDGLHEIQFQFHSLLFKNRGFRGSVQMFARDFTGEPSVFGFEHGADGRVRADGRGPGDGA